MDEHEPPIEKGKLFVGGLSEDTTKESLQAYFSQFGRLIDSVVMMDSTTKRSKGFGFVKFENASHVDTVLASGPHILDGKTVDPKQASEKGQTPDSPKKIFVGGLSTYLTEADLEAYFAQYGKVTCVDLKKDKLDPTRSRGFGFVTFTDSSVLQTVVNARYHHIGDKTAEVKVAEPKSSTRGGGGAGGGQGRPGGVVGGGATSYGSGYSGKGEQYSYSGYSYSGYHSPGQTYSSGYSYPSYSYGYSRSGHGGSPAGQSRPYYGSGGYEYSRYGDSQGGGRGYVSYPQQQRNYYPDSQEQQEQGHQQGHQQGQGQAS